MLYDLGFQARLVVGVCKVPVDPYRFQSNFPVCKLKTLMLPSLFPEAIILSVSSNFIQKTSDYGFPKKVLKDSFLVLPSCIPYYSYP